MLLCTMVILIFIGLMRLGPDIPFTRMLHLRLVGRPVAWFAERERHELMFVLVLLGFSAGGWQLLAMLGPEAAIVYAADLALYLDAMMISYLAATTVRIRAVVRMVRTGCTTVATRIRRLSPTSVRTAARSGQRLVKADNDEDEDLGASKMAA